MRYRCGFGIAGNFALHLEQAGESDDFKTLQTDDPNAPKGIFPFYLEGFEGVIGENPLDAHSLYLPKQSSQPVQAEPEVALQCRVDYSDGRVQAITPVAFAAFNDASLRIKGADKISQKKNWGHASKGVSENFIALDTFEPGSMLDGFRIASFLRRDGMVMRYGEDTELTGYTYFYETLQAWMITQFNTQKNEGPLEPLHDYLERLDYPKEMLITIGATRYTPFGENNFLQAGDEIIVVVYVCQAQCMNNILNKVTRAEYESIDGSVLVQKVKAYGER